MSLDAYAIFDAVVKEKSFTRAAERINLTPSAISHSISKLESRFNMQLFNRTKNCVELTSAGEHLMPYISNVLREEVLLQQEADFMNGKECGHVRIGTFSSICTNWIPDIVHSFHQKHPSIDVSIYQGGYDDISNWIKTKAVDLAFVSTAFVSEKDVTILHYDSLVCVTPVGFHPIHETYVTFEDFLQNRIIGQHGTNNAETERFLNKHNISLHSQFQIEDDRSLVTMVECGFGICLLQELVLENMNAKVQVFPIKPASYRQLGLRIVDTKFATLSTRLMYDHIVKFLPENKNLRQSIKATMP